MYGRKHVPKFERSSVNSMAGRQQYLGYMSYLNIRLAVVDKCYKTNGKDKRTPEN